MEKKTNNSQTADTATQKKGNSALRAASMGRSATEQVDAHSNSGLANTGTNISYEGATAPGAGGSVASGYASGKQAADEKISTNSDYAQNRGGSPSKSKASGKKETGDNEVEDADFEEEDDELDDEGFDDEEEEQENVEDDDDL